MKAEHKLTGNILRSEQSDPLFSNETGSKFAPRLRLIRRALLPRPVLVNGRCCRPLLDRIIWVMHQTGCGPDVDLGQGSATAIGASYPPNLEEFK